MTPPPRATDGWATVRLREHEIRELLRQIRPNGEDDPGWADGNRGYTPRDAFALGSAAGKLVAALHRIDKAREG